MCLFLLGCIFFILILLIQHTDSPAVIHIKKKVINIHGDDDQLRTDIITSYGTPSGSRCEPRLRLNFRQKFNERGTLNNWGPLL